MQIDTKLLFVFSSGSNNFNVALVQLLLCSGTAPSCCTKPMPSFEIQQLVSRSW